MPRRLLPILLCLMSSALAGSPGAAAPTSPYVIDGLALGAQFRPERDYSCKPSIQFTDVTWCLRKKPGRTGRGSVVSTTSILQAPGGAIAYVNREVEPAFFGSDEIQNEINRLATKFGERARVMRLPTRPGLPNAVIASWGGVELEQLDDDVASTLAADGSAPRLGLLVDYLGDIRKSAQLRLPIFRLAGGAGYLWSASSGDSGRGHLRFLEIDASALAPGKASKPPSPPQPAPATVETEKPAAKLPKVNAERPAAEPPRSVAEPTRPVAEPTRVATEPTRAVAEPRNVAAEPTKPVAAAPKVVAEPARRVAEPAGNAVESTGTVSQAPKHAERDDAAAQRQQAYRLAAEERERARIAWARYEAERAAAEAKGASWSLTKVAMIGFTTLAIVALLLAMRIQRNEAEQTELRDAARRADLRARLGQPADREADLRTADVRATSRTNAEANPSLTGALKSYVSAACLLTIAVSIYLGSQNPGAIKNFFGHFGHASAPATFAPTR
jgi:hypothetical protein